MEKKEFELRNWKFSHTELAYIVAVRWFESASKRAPDATCHLNDFNETLPTPTLKETKRFIFWLFPWEDRSPGFCGFHQRNRFSIRKFMKISLQCYLTDYPGRLYTYCSILNKCTTQISVNLTYSLSRQINDCFFFFLTFRFIQIFDNFEVKYLPLPESYNNNLIPRYNPLLRF